ncbi:bifunctional adenosylcobinamide kinase/adenosylcobinamide-phosphate guanylyltransferase [Calderihabitans maritimus]|uniref:Adenosylcobinamide kinase n=1 Tax=Calderihabitans maritimus TaxID=1246530 RepID=A0A1Z5HQH1_9FIRM|nr:bifunctional adenosylcobinamide kinase/adenosylcobinamide-phosphate guanylyltransferase [Calderihabitans maritimus]GAW91530.1 Adenosylcobinamide-phosphateguanylyltransferase [Calderihabitans maritimus]
MVRGKLIFVTGGARSGKSSYAERMAAELGEKVVYLATAQARDEEMKRRIATHKARRPAHWVTIEEPLAVAEVIRQQGPRTEVILLDCLTVLVSNLLLQEENKYQTEETAEENEVRILNTIDDMITAARESPCHVIVVSNEVGMGVVPPYPMGRLYRDLIGKANQMVAEAADEVFFLVSGIPLKIKG